MKKAIKSPFIFLLVVLSLKRDDYKGFREIAANKYFCRWQWRMLDRIMRKDERE